MGMCVCADLCVCREGVHVHVHGGDVDGCMWLGVCMYVGGLGCGYECGGAVCVRGWCVCVQVCVCMCGGVCMGVSVVCRAVWGVYVCVQVWGCVQGCVCGGPGDRSGPIDPRG